MQQQHQTHGGKEVQDDEGQQYLGDHGGGNLRYRQPAPTQQAHAHDTTTDTCDREQPIDRFADRRHPQQITKSGAALRVVRPQQPAPAERVEGKVHRAIWYQPKQSPPGLRQRLQHGSKVGSNDQSEQQRESQKDADMGSRFQTPSSGRTMHDAVRVDVKFVATPCHTRSEKTPQPDPA